MNGTGSCTDCAETFDLTDLHYSEALGGCFCNACLADLTAPPAPPEKAAAGLAAARAALQTRGSTEGTSTHGN